MAATRRTDPIYLVNARGNLPFAREATPQAVVERTLDLLGKYGADFARNMSVTTVVLGVSTETVPMVDFLAEHAAGVR